jgi:hypothetical protein
MPWPTLPTLVEPSPRNAALHSSGVWIMTPSVPPVTSSRSRGLMLGADAAVLTLIALRSRSQLVRRRSPPADSPPQLSTSERTWARLLYAPPLAERLRQMGTVWIWMALGTVCAVVVWRLRMGDAQFPSAFCPFLGYCSLD